MKSIFNKRRRRQRRKERDIEKRRARRIGLGDIPKNRKLKTDKYDHRPNKTRG